MPCALPSDVTDIHPIEFGLLLEKLIASGDEVEVLFHDGYVCVGDKTYYQTIEAPLSEEAQKRWDAVKEQVKVTITGM